MNDDIDFLYKVELLEQMLEYRKTLKNLSFKRLKDFCKGKELYKTYTFYNKEKLIEFICYIHFRDITPIK